MTEMPSNLKERWEKYLSLLGVTLLPYQQELSQELLKVPVTAKVKQSRQSGKSFIMALVLYFLMVINNWDIIITAPKLDQTWAIMRHIHRIQNRIKYKVIYDNRYSISLRGRGSIQCLSGSETANVEGPSAHVVVVDEHQDVPSEHISEVFLPMLSWTDGALWSSGIGGSPESFGEREGVDFEWVVDWEKVVEQKPGYKRLVDLARREMLPEEFDAHYGCKRLDISSHLLIPRLIEWDGVLDLNDKNIRSIIGIDFGKIDHTIGTLAHAQSNNLYLQNWILSKGSYDMQVDELTTWINRDTEYDDIYAETNGVGDGVTDFLILKVPEVTGVQINQDWKNTRARELNSMSREGRIFYNINHPLAGAFKKNMEKVTYTISINSNISIKHSDFISSLFLCIEEKREAYL